ncbi:O-succinylbenzoic acid--CoA ligase [Actinobacillus indolicus]|nr:O-succinylbenzoic acid--CoA ligase [Actinobacillus indolicus]VTU08550.1 O-succinylbenzoic acid--CoA ligase [Actinobacillus indolicus]
MAEFPFFPIYYWAEKQPQEIALNWDKGNLPYFSNLPSSLSWRELASLIEQAVVFIDFFAGKQSIVAYSGTHRLVGLLCYCAALASGRQILMLNPAMTEIQRCQILQDNQIHSLITDQDFANFSADLTACITEFPSSFSLIEPATLTLTSGSSGKPKAVVHSIAQHISSAESVCDFMQFTRENAWLLSLPLFHVSGQGIVWRWLSKGATLYITESKENLWQILSQVSHASLVPTQLQRYLSWLGDCHVDQHILLGGAVIPKDLIVSAQQRGITTYAGYGMTEMASTICAVKNDVDNVGKPLINREVKIVEGEIWVRGASLALGYWDRGVIIPLTNQEGWFATKDRGQWNHQGKLEVLGRLDNMFISGGENIQPEEIERTLFKSLQLKQIFIVPAYDDEFGERPVAIVEFHEPFNLQAVSLLQHFATQHLEKFKQPIRYFPLTDSIKQGSGIKISRKKLKEYVAQRIREHHV